MGVYALPCAGLHEESLHDDLVVIKKHRPRNSRVDETVVFHLFTRRRRCGRRMWFERDPQQFNRTRTAVDASFVVLRTRRRRLPAHCSSFHARDLRTVRMCGPLARRHLDPELIAGMSVWSLRCSRWDHELLDDDSIVIEERFAADGWVAVRLVLLICVLPGSRNHERQQRHRPG